MKKIQTKKLVLSKQSIRALTNEDSARVKGGTSAGWDKTGMGSSGVALVTTVPRMTTH